MTAMSADPSFAGVPTGRPFTVHDLEEMPDDGRAGKRTRTTRRATRPKLPATGRFHRHNAGHKEDDRQWPSYPSGLTGQGGMVAAVGDRVAANSTTGGVRAT